MSSHDTLIYLIHKQYELSAFIYPIYWMLKITSRILGGG